ncbi:hypothetical protein ACFXDF_34440 [Streptomyces sp. NPDC059426]|uniref:hypothetical protein n=1 Tax=Streptomyces sp. NPDC059426 TaxID=3346827 RepID=UPI0036A50E81
MRRRIAESDVVARCRAFDFPQPGKSQEKRHRDTSLWASRSERGARLMTPGRHAAARDRSPSWWAGVVEWRNWRLPVKLGAVLVVPALLAVALGVVQIQRDVARANTYADVQRLVRLRGGLMPLIGDLQMERTMSAARLR